jgi:hypothetical protein
MNSKLHDMPWKGQHLISPEELRQWEESRKQAAEKLDVETCECKGAWGGNSEDPYGLHPEIPTDDYNWMKKTFYVRSSETHGWVWEGHLPQAKRDALLQRR